MRTKRAVKQLDCDGNVINVFESVSEASEKTDTNVSSIVNCCRKKIKTANGFIWTYDNSKFKLNKDPLDFFLDFL